MNYNSQLNLLLKERLEIKINKIISIWLSIVFIPILCAGCNENTMPQSQLKESKIQSTNNGHVDEKKDTSTETTSEMPAKSSIEPFIVLKDIIHPSLPELHLKYMDRKRILYTVQARLKYTRTLKRKKKFKNWCSVIRALQMLIN